jgi:hypothetical protein
VEESVLDVELVHGPTPRDSQSQHSPNGGKLDDGAEGLVVVYPRALSEASKDPMSLVLIKRAIRLELVLEDPLGIGPKRSRNQVAKTAGYSSIVRRQWRSASALRTEVGTGDSVGGAAPTESCR